MIRLGVTGLKKNGDVDLLDLFGRRGRKKVQFIVCAVPLDYRANAGSVDVFSSVGRWSYSKDWVLEFKDKIMLHCFGKLNVSMVTFQEFDITYHVLGYMYGMYSGVLMVSNTIFALAGPRLFPGAQNLTLLFNFDIVNFLVKLNGRRNRRPNIVIFVV